MRGDGSVRKEEPIGDLAVGQAPGGERDDLVLLGRQPVYRVGSGRRRSGDDTAGPQFGLRPHGPWVRPEVAERLQSGRRLGPRPEQDSTFTLSAMPLSGQARHERRFADACLAQKDHGPVGVRTVRVGHRSHHGHLSGSVDDLA
jgi:hypothetical protein